MCSKHFSDRALYWTIVEVGTRSYRYMVAIFYTKVDTVHAVLWQYYIQY